MDQRDPSRCQRLSSPPLLVCISASVPLLPPCVCVSVSLCVSVCLSLCPSLSFSRALSLLPPDSHALTTWPHCLALAIQETHTGVPAALTTLPKSFLAQGQHLNLPLA